MGESNIVCAFNVVIDFRAPLKIDEHQMGRPHKISTLPYLYFTLSYVTLQYV